MRIRTKQKDTELHSDKHVITNKWQEIPDGEVHVYLDNPNVEVERGKPAAEEPEPEEK